MSCTKGAEELLDRYGVRDSALRDSILRGVFTGEWVGRDCDA